MKTRTLNVFLACCLLLSCVPALAPATAASSEPEPVGADYSLSFGDTISAGMSHMVVIKEDGTLWAWGRNTDNRLGIGATEDAVTAPVQVPLDKKVVSVSAGSDTTAVLTADGELWNWGNNVHGSLGRKAEGEIAGPGKMMDGVCSIGNSGRHCGAITYDGTLWVWGSNTHGELGNNRQGTIVAGHLRSISCELLPTRVMENARSVVMRPSVSFAILNDGTLWGWGATAGASWGTIQVCGPAPERGSFPTAGTPTRRKRCWTAQWI